MNKKSIKSTFLKKEVFIYFLLSLFLVNCSDKFDDYELSPPEPTFSIPMAKSWFETNLQPVIDRNLIKPKTEGSSIIDLQPLFNWDLAELYSNSNWAVVELPWEYEEGIVTYVGEGEGFSSGYNPFESTQITKLVILNNLATEEIYGFKMVVLPDINYLALGGDLSNTTYLNQDAEFTGIILFYSVLDQFVNGWIYKNGQITGTLHLAENPDKSENTGIFSKSKGWFYVEFCWYQYFVYPDGSQSEPMLLDCSWQSYYIQDYFDSQEGGGGFDPGGGGSSGGTISPSSVYQPAEGDTFFKNSVTPTMDVQILNECLLAIMEYVSQELCGLSHNVDYFSTSYYNEYGIWAYLFGVNTEHAMPFLAKHFRSRPFQGFQNEINNGRMVITDIIVQGQAGITHAVAIVGYKPNGRLIYMDPAKGLLWEGVPTMFGINFVFAARGCF